MAVPSPHNEAKLDDIANVVIMPGDPLRAKYVAENFLKDAKCVNKVRNMLAYTGTYNDKRITIMGSGMGMPSFAIYSYELYNFYNVSTIIRIGTCGALADNINLRDIILAQAASTDSAFCNQFKLDVQFAPISTYDLLENAVQKCRESDLKFKIGNVLSTDAFYYLDNEFNTKLANMGVLAADMETAALYMYSAYFHKRTLAILTASDHILRKQSLSAKDRELSFTDMIKIALNVAYDEVVNLENNK